MRIFPAAILGVALILNSCSRPETVPVPVAAEPVEHRGLHNVRAIRAGLWSGSSPEGDAGFASLRELGIKTIISVDGARPEIATAKNNGMKYVHIPVGYNGISPEQRLQLVKTFRDLPGPIYLHCHHGKHRGPAAAVLIERSLNPLCSSDQGEEMMRSAGTGSNYVGLYEAVRSAQPISDEELRQVKFDFPEVAVVPDLVKAMVEIDERWDRLKLLRKAGWQQAAKDADLDPAHEALQLAELFRESARRAKETGNALHKYLDETAEPSQRLENALKRPQDQQRVELAELAFRQIESDCTRCHALVRDRSTKK